MFSKRAIENLFVIDNNMINKNLHANKKIGCFLIESAYTDAMLKNRASFSSSLEKYFNI